MSKENISWIMYNNVAGVVASAIMIAAAFFGVATRVSVIETKLDAVIAGQQEMLQKYASVENRYGRVALELQCVAIGTKNQQCIK